MRAFREAWGGSGSKYAMIDIKFGIHDDKWCAPLAVLDVADECAVTLEFYLPANFRAAGGIPATVVLQGQRHLVIIAAGNLTAAGPFAVPPGGARIAIEFPVATQLEGGDLRVVGALLARLLVNDQEVAIRPPPSGPADRGFALVAV
jgi:hypothetical protein